MIEVLRRVEGRFSEVRNCCDAAIIIGGGTSLIDDQIYQALRWRNAAERRIVIGINDAYLRAPFVDVLYFADAEWWRWHTKGVDRKAIGLSAIHVAERFASYHGQKCSISNQMKEIHDPTAHILRDAGWPYALSSEPQKIYKGYHGGYQAINIATLAGAKLIVLLGYDLREPRDGEKTHWFGEHERPAPISTFAKYRNALSQLEPHLLKAGVRTINASPGTAIDAFEKMPIEHALTCAVPAA